MKTEFEVCGKLIQFERNWFTGLFKCYFDGKTRILQNPFDPRTHFWLTLSKTYKIPLENRVLKIVQRRPLLLSFAKPLKYKFWLDNEMIHEHEG